MAYTALQLITESYGLSGIVSNEFQAVTGSQESQGLTWLNDLLGIKTADTRLVPYYQYIQVPFVAGQMVYYIPNLIELATVTFNIGPIRYGMTRIYRRNWYGTSRVDNVQSLPFQYFFDRTLGGANIDVYFSPQTNWTMNIDGKFGLLSIPSLTTDLTLYYDRYYITYLKYGLAQFICANNQIVFAPENAKLLDSLEVMIMDIAPIDTVLDKTSFLSAKGIGNWAFINLAQGWSPG